MKENRKWSFWAIWGLMLFVSAFKAEDVITFAKAISATSLVLLVTNALYYLTDRMYSSQHSNIFVEVVGMLRGFVYAYTAVFAVLQYVFIATVLSYILQAVGMVHNGWYEELYQNGRYIPFVVTLLASRIGLLFATVYLQIVLFEYGYRSGWYQRLSNEERPRETISQLIIIFYGVPAAAMFTVFGEAIVSVATWSLPIWFQ